jgi:hypothetical protein
VLLPLTFGTFENIFLRNFMERFQNIYASGEDTARHTPSVQKKFDVLVFKICKKNDVLLNLACMHVHVDMQQSIST